MLGGDQARGADAVLGSFLRLWESRSSFRPCGQLGAWLLKTTNRLCLDTISQSRPNERLDESRGSVAGPQSCVELTVLAQAVRDAVVELPETHRGVLILSVYEDTSYGEIAAALEISPGTVASRKNHAVAMLRRRLAAWETR